MTTLSEARKAYAYQLKIREYLFEKLSIMYLRCCDMDKEYFKEAGDQCTCPNSSIEKVKAAEEILLSELEKILADIETRCRQLINHTTSSGHAIIKEIMSLTVQWEEAIKDSISKAKKEAIKEILFLENERRLGGED